MRIRKTAAPLLALALVLAPASTAAWADEPDLEQTIDPAQPIVTGAKTLSAGHVDMGPRFEGGEWTFLIHDDAANADANAQSTWRHPTETVFHVLDTAAVTVPDDPAYEFLGADAGTTAYVVPQTQDPEVVWLGWNTQDPEVMAAIDRGITLSLTGVQGPGIVTVYLQSGSFGEPQVLWDSRVAEPQPLWVDVNTHTHANWVFTEPGVYLMRLTAEADLIDGSAVSDTQYIRLAVGSETDPGNALSAAWERGELSTPVADKQHVADDGRTDDLLVPVLLGGIGLVAVLIIVGTLAVIRDARLRRRTLAKATFESDDS